MKKLTLWSVWSVASKQREHRTQLSSSAQSLEATIKCRLIDNGEEADTHLHRKQLSPFLNMFPQGRPGRTWCSLS